MIILIKMLQSCFIIGIEKWCKLNVEYNLYGHPLNAWCKVWTHFKILSWSKTIKILYLIHDRIFTWSFPIPMCIPDPNYTLNMIAFVSSEVKSKHITDICKSELFMELFWYSLIHHFLRKIDHFSPRNDSLSQI